MKETEIGSLVVEWLKREKTDWKIFEEIRPAKYAGGRIADIVCMNALEDIWVIELKRSLNLDVIRQAYSWQVEYRSVAFEYPKKRSDNIDWWLHHLKHKMGIGSIYVSAFGNTRENEKPTLQERCFHSKNFVQVCKSGNTEGFSKAGSKGGGYWTPYKQTMIEVKKYISEHPGCGVGDIVRDLGKMHYASEHSAKTNIVSNLKTLEENWCKTVKQGYYDTFFVKEENE